MSKEVKQFRTFKFKATKAEDDGKLGFIEGYASTFGNVDQGYDVVDKGAFLKTINDKKGRFPILLDHDPCKQIGWNLEAQEDEYGLRIKGELQLITEEAQNRYALAKRAAELDTQMGLSIGYSTIKAEPDFDQPMVRHLKELKLWEYSLVTFPMNVEAGVTGVKAIQNLFLSQLQRAGYTDLDAVKKALEAEPEGDQQRAADHLSDPALCQSVEQLIQTIRA